LGIVDQDKEPDMSKLQESHDTLAAALAEVLDQIVRGRHGPTKLQLLKAANALSAASPYMTETTWLRPKGAKAIGDEAAVILTTGEPTPRRLSIVASN